MGSLEGHFSFKVVSVNDLIIVVINMKTTHGSDCDRNAIVFIKISCHYYLGHYAIFLVCLCCQDNFPLIGR